MQRRLRRDLIMGGRQCALASALLALPCLCGALDGTVANERYHAPQEVFSCPLPGQQGSPHIDDRIEANYCGVGFYYGVQHYRVDCYLHSGQKEAYWGEPAAELTGEAQIKRQLLRVHPDWEEQHVRISRWEVLQHEGNPLVFAVAVVGGPAASMNTVDGRALDAVYACAIYRCFHLFVLSLHDTLADLLLSDLPPASKSRVATIRSAQNPVQPQEAIDDLRDRLLRFSSGLQLGRRDYAGHIRRAAQAGDAWAVRQMIAAGADVNARDEKGTTPLMKAAAEGHAGVARVLLAAGAQVDAAEAGTEYVGWTALMYAVEWNHPQLVRLLLEAGANPAREAQIKQGDKLPLTALMLAAGVDGKGRPESLKALLEWGLEAEPLALFFVAFNGRADLLRVMLDCGVHPDTRSVAGSTALILAAAFGQAELVRTLLAAGADVRIRDERGLTALQHAEAQGHREVAQLLQAAQ